MISSYFKAFKLLCQKKTNIKSQQSLLILGGNKDITTGLVPKELCPAHRNIFDRENSGGNRSNWTNNEQHMCECPRKRNSYHSQAFSWMMWVRSVQNYHEKLQRAQIKQITAWEQKIPREKRWTENIPNFSGINLYKVKWKGRIDAESIHSWWFCYNWKDKFCQTTRSEILFSCFNWKSKLHFQHEEWYARRILDLERMTNPALKDPGNFFNRLQNRDGKL